MMGCVSYQKSGSTGEQISNSKMVTKTEGRPGGELEQKKNLLQSFQHYNRKLTDLGERRQLIFLVSITCGFKMTEVVAAAPLPGKTVSTQQLEI